MYVNTTNIDCFYGTYVASRTNNRYNLIIY
nr:MAG TPA: hypothetical protein [Caudoviricetes sp.]